MIRKYKDIVIRNATKDDAPDLLKWWNDGKIMEHAGFPNGLQTTLEDINKKIEESKIGVFERLIIEVDQIKIGEMSFSLDETGAADIGIKICDESYRNKGIGRICLSELICSLFDEYEFNEIVLTTQYNNKRAMHVYESLGFKLVKIEFNAWKDQIGNLRSIVHYRCNQDSFVNYAVEIN